MEKILVLNAKGGCGKTTIATNLASHYACADFKTVLNPIAGYAHNPKELIYMRVVRAYYRLRILTQSITKSCSFLYPTMIGN